MSAAPVRKVLIAGGNGAVGNSLRTQFRQLGLVLDHSVISFIILTRSKKRCLNTEGISHITWDDIKKEGLPDCDTVINLTGANIVQSAWKKDGPVYTSRINTTRDLIEAMKKNPPKTFVSASAVGIYPTNTKETLDENSKLLDYSEMNFPQQLVYDWEQEANKAKEFTKTTIARISFVLGSRQNGVKSLLLPFGIGIGKIGTGEQPFPWIHEVDLAKMLFHSALDPDATGGVINAVSPQQITQAQFATVFNRETKRMINIPLPASVIKLIGEKSTLLLEGPNVVPKELYNVLPSFKFTYPTIHEATKNMNSGILSTFYNESKIN